MVEQGKCNLTSVRSAAICASRAARRSLRPTFPYPPADLHFPLYHSDAPDRGIRRAGRLRDTRGNRVNSLKIKSQWVPLEKQSGLTPPYGESPWGYLGSRAPPRQ